MKGAEHFKNHENWQLKCCGVEEWQIPDPPTPEPTPGPGPTPGPTDSPTDPHPTDPQPTDPPAPGEKKRTVIFLEKQTVFYLHAHR